MSSNINNKESTDDKENIDNISALLKLMNANEDEHFPINRLPETLNNSNSDNRLVDKISKPSGVTSNDTSENDSVELGRITEELSVDVESMPSRDGSVDVNIPSQEGSLKVNMPSGEASVDVTSIPSQKESFQELCHIASIPLLKKIVNWSSLPSELFKLNLLKLLISYMPDRSLSENLNNNNNNRSDDKIKMPSGLSNDDARRNVSLCYLDMSLRKVMVIVANMPPELLKSQLLKIISKLFPRNRLSENLENSNNDNINESFDKIKMPYGVISKSFRKKSRFLARMPFTLKFKIIKLQLVKLIIELIPTNRISGNLNNSNKNKISVPSNVTSKDSSEHLSVEIESIPSKEPSI